jgi:hypothetical protein
MRPGQNNKRMRGRPNNRKGPNPLTRSYESSGPDVKIRGTAHHIGEKYLQLARDAQASGDPVMAESYLQHAEHYFRLIAAAQEQFRQNQPQPRADTEMQPTSEDGDDEGESFSHFGQEPGFVPQQQQQPYIRDNNPREQRGDNQPYQRDQQPREHREREHRPQPQYQPQPQPQPVIADNGGVDRLPSFITGPQPQVNGAPGGYEEGGRGGERFPRRRRRPHSPRPEGMAAPAAPSEDLNPGNE